MLEMTQNMSWCNILGMKTLPAVRINDCGLADYPPGSVLGPRTVPDHEILWIERGECRWESGEETQTCPPGSVMMCPPGMVDRWVWDPHNVTRHGYLHFDFIGDPPIDLPPRRDCPRDDVVRPLLRHAVWLASLGGEDKERLAEEALHQALTWYTNGLLSQGGESPASDIHPVLVRALAVLRQRWGAGPKTPPAISVWAANAGVSRGHLARVCRQELGVSPQELLRYLRLDHSLFWLGRTNMKISEISEMCGFQSQFHFSRCLKDTYGYGPRELRKQLRAGGDRPLSKVIGLRRILRIVG